jgi:hypothetical protein
MGRFRRSLVLAWLVLCQLAASISASSSPPQAVALVSARPGRGISSLQAALSNPAVSTLIVQGAGLNVPSALGAQLLKINRWVCAPRATAQAGPPVCRDGTVGDDPTPAAL